LNYIDSLGDYGLKQFDAFLKEQADLENTISNLIDLPSKHGWVPHMTIGYYKDDDDIGRILFSFNCFTINILLHTFLEYLTTNDWLLCSRVLVLQVLQEIANQNLGGETVNGKLRLIHEPMPEQNNVFIHHLMPICSSQMAKIWMALSQGAPSTFKVLMKYISILMHVQHNK